MSAMPSTSAERQTRRRRKTTRCCGLYSPMIPKTGDLRGLEAMVGNEQASTTAMAVREARGVCRAFATRTKIHGVKDIYLAQG